MANTRRRPQERMPCPFDAITGQALPNQVMPANRSMFRSSLYNKGFSPNLKGLSVVQAALDQDIIRQRRKYGTSDASLESARFNVKMPSGNQSNKFSWRGKSPLPDLTSRCSPSPESLTCSTRASPSPTSFSCISPTTVRSETPGDYHATGSQPMQMSLSNEMGGVRFNMDRLASWFRSIDATASGRISQREFIVHLRKNPFLLQLFYRIHWNKCDRETTCESQTSEKATLESPIRNEIRKIKEILAQVGLGLDGKDNTIGFVEFVDFFRRAGLLLEYKTREDLNSARLSMMAAQRLSTEGAVINEERQTILQGPKADR